MFFWLISVGLLSSLPSTLGVVLDQPTEPTLCNASNQGDCECGSGNIKTYVFWPGIYQRCIHTYIPSGHSEPLPALIEVSAYGQGKISQNAKIVKAADYYGFAVIGMGSTGPKDGAGGFGLEFPANGVVNGNNPTPCAEEDSRDYGYIQGTFDFIASLSSDLDPSRVYLHGFSQNSMYAAYISVCFADRVAGLWQGGSGLAKTFHAPVTPGWQGQCSNSAFQEHGSDCCDDHFCTDCTYWPVYPRTCENKIVDCIASYTDDGIACGTDWYMYEAMVAEGNDARLLSFEPTSEGGAHSDPRNTHSWVVGCLGIVDSCSDFNCEPIFQQCVDSKSGTGIANFEACEAEIAAGNLPGCAVGCAPTIGMLTLSESPLVTLSNGKFGTQESLSSHVGSAPKPNCDFGSFDDPNVNHNKCQPPNGAGPGPEVTGSCSGSTKSPVTSVTNSPVAGTSSPTGSPVKGPTNPDECEESCEDEFPNCVRATNCDNCFAELADPESLLVRIGECTVSCTPTFAMNTLCGITSAPTLSPIKPSGMPTGAPLPPVRIVGYNASSSKLTNDGKNWKPVFKFQVKEKSDDETKVIGATFLVSYLDQKGVKKERSCTTNKKGKCKLVLSKFKVSKTDVVDVEMENVVIPTDFGVYDSELNRKTDGCPLFSSKCPSFSILQPS